MYFYFEQLFRTALTGINGTSVMPTIVQIGGGILLASLLFNVYEAFVRGGDARLLGIGGIKYLAIGLIFLNYGPIFMGVNTMFNQVAEFISTIGPGGSDVFNSWANDMSAAWQNDPSFAQQLWDFVTGSIVGAVEALLLILATIIYIVAYALFCVLYAFYGSVLYVCGPLVLALYPAMGTTPLARSYLVNLVIFHAWGLIYAILGCLVYAINLGTVAQVIAQGNAGGFFTGLSNALLLGLASILLALCIALIPFIAKRIVQGDVGSTMFAVIAAATTAATVGATAAINGLTALGGSSGGGAAGGGGGSGASGGGGAAGGAGGGRSAAAASVGSSQAPPPRPPAADGASDTSPTERVGAAAEVSGTEAASSSAPPPRPAEPEAQGHHSGRGRGWRPYRPLDLVGMASAGAGRLAGRGARSLGKAFSRNGDHEGEE
jgi:hypothetical protein